MIFKILCVVIGVSIIALPLIFIRMWSSLSPIDLQITYDGDPDPDCITCDGTGWIDSDIECHCVMRIGKQDGKP